MKKYALITLGMIFGGVAVAQTVEEAKKSMYNGRYATAANVLNTIVSANPADAEAWYWLTRASVEQDKLADLQSRIAAALPAVGNEPLVQVAYGEVLLQQGKTAEAQQQFDKALDETREKNAEVLRAIAKAHVEAKSGDANYALQLLEKAIKRDKRSPENYMIMGDAYRKLQKGSEAFQAYRDALEKDDKYVPALFALGKIFTTQKNAEMYLEYFNKALAIDPSYAPALYEMYSHYYYADVAKAMEYFNQYAANSDKSVKNDYLYTDLLYLAKQYDKAIKNAQNLLKASSDAEPRLYKLIAYSYQGLKDTTTALNYMNQYFAKSPDSNFVVKDFETMGEIYARMEDKRDSAAFFFEKAVALETDTSARYAHYKRLADLYGSLKDYHGQAQWLGKYYAGNDKATNLDLFNWGLAHFRAQEYVESDTVFAQYAAKYPDQAFGYYWRARSNAVLDKGMEQGLAVPHYTKVIEVASQDTTNETNRKWMVEAYAYLAAYETNTNKNYATAIDYFEKLLAIDPENADAKKYIAILEKNVANSASSASAAEPAEGSK